MRLLKNISSRAGASRSWRAFGLRRQAQRDAAFSARRPAKAPSPLRSAGAVQRLRAFSLIEIMVAVAILAVIIVGLLAMFYMVQRAFRSGTAQVDVMEGGRSTMGVVTRELAELAATYQDGVKNFYFSARPFTATPSTYVPSTNKLIGGEQRFNTLHDLTFMRRVNDEWIATAYRIQYADSGVGTLYRMVINGSATNLALLSDATCVTNLPFFVPPPPQPQPRPAPVSSNGFYPVLEGVVSFRIDVFDTDGNLYQYYNPTSPGPYTVVGDSRWGRYTIAGNENRGYAFLGSALPAYVDVELAVLEPSALTRFKYRAESDVAPAYPKARAYLAEQAGRLHVFRQRIPIRASSADTGDGP